MTFAGVWSEATHPKDYPARQYTTVLVSEILTTGRHQLHEALLSTLWHIALAVETIAVLAQWILTRLVIRVPPRLRLCESLVAQSQLHHLRQSWSARSLRVWIPAKCSGRDRTEREQLPSHSRLVPHDKQF